MRTTPRTARRVVVGVVGVVVVVVGLAQVVLPGVAAQRMREELERYGTVRSTSISAVPAIELLWGHAQSASASAGHLAFDPTQAGEELWRARAVQQLDVRADTMRIGPFAMQRVSLRKRGAAVTIEGDLDAADLRAVMPASTEVQILGNAPTGVRMLVSGSVFGTHPSIEVLLAARGGRLVAQPRGVPFVGGLQVTLLATPHMYVQRLAVAGGPSAGSGGSVHRLSMAVQLR